MRAIAWGDEIEVRGDGAQTRDFTFFDDALDATVRSATADVVGEVLNIGGGSLWGSHIHLQAGYSE